MQGARATLSLRPFRYLVISVNINSIRWLDHHEPSITDRMHARPMIYCTSGRIPAFAALVHSARVGTRAHRASMEVCGSQDVSVGAFRKRSRAAYPPSDVVQLDNNISDHDRRLSYGKLSLSPILYRLIVSTC